MAMVASRMRLRRSRCASEPSSDSASTATFMTSRGCESRARSTFVFAGDTGWAAPVPGGWFANDTHSEGKFPTSPSAGTAIFRYLSCCDGVRLDVASLALLEHVL